MPLNRVTKKCTRCGLTSFVRPRVRRCKRLKFGAGSYACWGRLERVVAPTPQRKEKLMARPQDEARKELTRLRNRIALNIDTLARVARSLKKQQAEAEKLERLASMTDIEYNAMKQARSAAAIKAHATMQRKRTRRAIDLEEDEA